MIRFRSFLLTAIVAVGAIIFALPTQAQAAFKIRISEDGGATYVANVQDNMAGDMAVAAGAISFFYMDAAVTFSVTVGQSKPLFGNNPYVAAMDISIVGTFNGGGTITVDITDTDFAPPGSPAGLGYLTAKIGSSAPGGTTMIGYLNGDDPGIAGPQGNKEFGGIDPTNGTLITTPLATAPGTLITTTNDIAYAPYSLSARTTFSGTAGSGFSLDNTLTFTLPVPAGLVLALSGTPVLGLGAWLRRRRSPIVVA